MKIRFFIWLIVAMIALLPLRQSVYMIMDYTTLKNNALPVTLQTPAWDSVDKNFFYLDIDRKIFETLSLLEADSKARITRINPSVRSEENEFVSFYTKEVIFEGEFTDILKMLSETEKNIEGIKFGSVSFVLVKEQTVNKLKAVVSFQSVKMKKDEDQ